MIIAFANTQIVITNRPHKVSPAYKAKISTDYIIFDINKYLSIDYFDS